MIHECSKGIIEDHLGFVDQDKRLSRVVKEYARFFLRDEDDHAQVVAGAHNVGNWRKALLLAHGSTDGQDWWYAVNGVNHEPVQAWVDRYDGQFAALFLFTCNPWQYRMSSSRSTVFHPLDVTSILDAFLGHTPIASFTPGSTQNLLSSYAVTRQ